MSKKIMRRQKLTPLQTVVVGMLIAVLLLVSINFAVTYSSNKKPSENLFQNSQTIYVLNN